MYKTYNSNKLGIHNGTNKKEYQQAPDPLVWSFIY